MKPKPRRAAQHRGEHRTRVGDQRHRPGRERVGLDVADRAQAPGHVHETHAARAAQRHARRPGEGRQPAPQAGPLARRSRRRCRRSPPTGRRGPPRHRAAPRARRRARPAGPGRPARAGRPGAGGSAARRPRRTGVHRVQPGPGLAGRDLGHHPLAQAARARARADQGHAAGLQHGGQRRVEGRLAATISGIPAPPGRANRWMAARAGSGRCLRGSAGGSVRGPAGPRRRRPLVSAIAALAACMPGMPQTPPPACVAELA